jgi:malate synthase
MRQYIEVEGLHVDPMLHSFVTHEAIPGSGVEASTFWAGLRRMVEELGPRNAQLIETRAALQRHIDDWHHRHPTIDANEYEDFLHEIGYLVRPGDSFHITTADVDPEVAVIAGPQLVVPVSNARYAINAANARWGSLYDALYGTDAMGSKPPDGPYDAERGKQVVAWVRTFLDETIPLKSGSHSGVDSYCVSEGRLVAEFHNEWTGLREPSRLAGFRGDPTSPEAIFFEHHGLHVELVIDSEHKIGRSDRAGISDVVIESAVTAIVDFEDSVAAVDANDKVAAYRNWLGLMTGNLTERVTKDGRTFIRSLTPDRYIIRPGGQEATLRGRALMMVRNVGHFMRTDAVRNAEGDQIPEGLLDALVTVLAAKHDLLRTHGPRNSSAGSVYVVKPKMHGPDEVTLAVDTFGLVEEVLGLAARTVKIGLMDEERRTTLNLTECIRAASERIAFINTGFLDRTGDEIHTSMEAGPMIRKEEMRTAEWMKAYEDHNVDVGLACGLHGRAQIGKGMWAAPDRMADMLELKIEHPRAGANCAWVPSPTAATLHATHYHRVDVARSQENLFGHPRASFESLLKIPTSAPAWSRDQIREEVKNNAQSILGYAVRWVDQGIGCSTVPDIHDVALMEDRATCRISSQHIANWLRHGVVDSEYVLKTLRRMAVVVDHQNKDDANYVPMGPRFDGEAFLAACDLIFTGAAQPSGYTEPVLQARRAQRKTQSVIKGI